MLSQFRGVKQCACETVYCNCCGQPIQKSEVGSKGADYLQVEKVWGYFSNKDLTGHSFNICEDCYDKWLKSFCIPVEEFPVDEIYNYTEEQLEQLNAAYNEVLCKKI